MRAAGARTPDLNLSKSLGLTYAPNSICRMGVVGLQRSRTSYQCCVNTEKARRVVRCLQTQGGSAEGAKSRK